MKFRKPWKSHNWTWKNIYFPFLTPLFKASEFWENFAKNDAQLSNIFYGEVSVGRFLKTFEAHADFMLRQFGVVLGYFGVFGVICAIFKSSCRILPIVFIAHTIILDSLSGRNPYDKFSNQIIHDQWLVSLGFGAIFSVKVVKFHSNFRKNLKSSTVVSAKLHRYTG